MKRFSWRRLAPCLFFFAALCVIVFRLASLQLGARAEGTDKNAASMAVREVRKTIKAARGMIVDRNGKILVTTKESTTAALAENAKEMSNEELRTLSVVVAQALRAQGTPYETTTFYTKTTAAGDVIIGTEYMGPKASRRYVAFLEEHGLAAYSDYNTVMGYVLNYFGMYETGLSGNALLEATYVRYDIDRCIHDGVGKIFAEDCSAALTAALTEKNTPGLTISTSLSRQYLYPGVASHLLGRTGLIQADDLAYYTELGYPMDAIVGIDGAERAFETELCGQDGVLVQLVDQSGTVTEQYIEKEPVAGKTVWLTIDIELQKAAEQALADNIAQIRAQGEQSEESGDGEDCRAGALVLMNPQSFEILAAASYPSFDLTTFSEDYASLSANEDKPYLNRALGGTYEPGSTFKVVTATAALEEGIVTPETEIYDEGIYTFYEDFQPRCWLYSYGRATHGLENVVGALRDSCNYYFFEVGRQLGIDRIVKYAQDYGLGQASGVELSESVGNLAGVKSRGSWTAGDTLQAAIGQSEHLFTPVQIASYFSTAVNGGTRRDAHFYLRSTVFFTEEETAAHESRILSEVPMSEQTHTVLMQGLSEVVERGSAVRIFRNFPVAVGGKTGTAQVGQSQSPNALFVGFAPFDDPQVVAVSVLEHGASGTNAAVSVRELLAAYFGFEE